MTAKFAVAALVRLVFAATATLGAGSASAQLPGFSADPLSIRAGSYEIDPLHTRVTWTTSHFGMSRYSGQLVELSGRLEVNHSVLAQSTLAVTIPMDKGGVFQSELDKRLLTEFFDAAKYPTATFSSTSIERVGDREVKVAGNLTLKGVTKPVMFAGTFNGSGIHPVSKRFTIGFNGETTIKRSDFGVTALLPAIGDEVRLALEVEFRLPN